MSSGQLPAPARRLVLGVGLAGLAATAVRVPEVAGWTRGDLLAWVGLAVGTAALEQFTISIRHSTETENFSLTDSLWVAGLLLVRPSVLTLAVLGGALVGQVARRWAVRKVAFNVAQFVVAVTVAELVFDALAGGGDLDTRAWIGAALGMVAYFVVNESVVAWIISLVEGKSFRSVVVLPAGLNVLHSAGNVTIGMLAALVWKSGPAGLPLLLAPIVLTYLAYRGWLHSKRSQEEAHERERMRTLYEAGLALFGPLDANLDFGPFLLLVRRMVDAASVELVVVDGESVTMYESGGGSSRSVTADGEQRPLEAYVRKRPGLSTYVATISGPEGARGVLAVHRTPALTVVEASLVDALASQVYVKLQNHRLFLETVEHRAHLEDIVANTSDGIFVVSPDRRILAWNPAMERITGYGRLEAIGQLSDRVLPVRAGGDDAHPGIGPLSPLSSETRDALVMARDGSRRWIRYTSNPIPGVDGRAKAYVLVARDVTAALETERLKAEFVATVSHELRSPLTPLKGFLISLVQGTVEDSGEARQEYYRIMLKQANRLDRLIAELLDVSQLEAGKLALDVRTVDLHEEVGDLVREFTDEEPGRTVRFTAPDSVLVRADPFRLQQVVANLVSNALKYSPPESPVEVVVRVVHDEAIVSVRDEGDGIPLSEQDRVFDRFHRVETGLTRRTGGTGLGLYIAKRLVEAMSGRIWLVSQPGKGSTLSFSLPLATTRAPADRGTGEERPQPVLAG